MFPPYVIIILLMKPLGVMKNLYLTTVAFLVLVFSTSNAYSQLSGPCAGSSCTANDFNLINFFLGDDMEQPFGDGFCDPGPPPEQVAAHIYVEFDSNTNAGRYSLYLYFDVKLTDAEGNVTISSETDCLYLNTAIPTSGLLDIYTFPWECGNEVELSNFYMSWQTSMDKPCGEQSSHCYCEPGPIVINAPLIPNFTTQTECVVGQSIENIIFTDVTTGGLQPYTDYYWSFGTNATPTDASTAGPHTVSYDTTGSQTITLTVTDSNGTFITEEKTITIGDANCCVLDIECPTTFTDTATCYSSLPPAATDQAGLEALGLIFNENCGTLYISHLDSGDPGCNGDVIRTYTILDDRNSNGTYEIGIDEQITCEETITINYTQGVTAVADTTSTIECPANATDPGNPGSVLDACGRTVDAVLIGQDATTPECEGEVIWRYRYTACDGSTDDYTHTYTIDYTQGVTAVADTTSTVECPANATDPGNPGSVLDACGRTVDAVLIGQDATTPECEGEVIWRYRYTACDGSTDDYTHTYTIDLSNFSLPSNDSSNVSCVADAQTIPTPPSANDSCGNSITPTGPVVSNDPVCQGIKTYTWTYTDCSGNSNDWVYTYNVNDNIAPDITNCTVGNLVLDCLEATNEANAIQWNLDNIAALEACATDNCDADLTGQVSSDYDFANLNTVCGPCGTLNITYLVSDECDNSTPITLTLTFSDGTGPDLSNCDVNSLTLECDGANNETISDQWDADNIAALEACTVDNTNVTISSNYAFTNLNTTCGQGGTIPVTYTITDECDNATSLPATLTLIDTTPPDLSGCSVTSQALECDGANNEAIADQWNADNISALEGCVADSCDPDFSGQVSSDYVYSNLVATCGQGGTIAVIYTITDDCGNEETLNATLTLEDTTPPDLSGCAVTSEALECDGANNEAIADQWNADNISALEGCVSDSCDPDFSGQVTSDYAYSNLSSTCGLGGTIAVIYTIIDDCGNIETLNATLTLEDTTPPDLSGCAVTSEALECDGANNEAIADQWNADNISALEGCVSDSCDPDFSGQVTSDYAYSNLSSTCGLGGTIAVIYTITDDCGNIETLNATLTLEDTTPPGLSGCAVTSQVLECTDDNEAAADAWNAANIAALEACVSDSCDPDFSGQVTSDYDFSNLNTTCGPCGNLSVNYTITDDCGNSSNLNATLSFDDITIPDLSDCNVNDLTLECSGNNNEALADQWDLDNIAALEACADDLNITISSNYAFANLVTSCGLGGSIPVIYTVTDDCNNSATLNVTLTFEDTTPPDLVNCTVADETMECAGADNEAISDQWNADNIIALQTCGTDSCDLDNTFVVSSDYAFTSLSTTCGAGGTITVTYTIIDDCNNSQQLTATLTLEDTTPPDLVNCTVVDTTLECAGTDNETIADQWNADNIAALQTCGTDSCDVDNTYVVASDYEFKNLATSCGLGGTIIVNYTITDDCNNSQALTAVLTIQDTTAPVIISEIDPEVTVFCTEIPEAPEVEASDECSDDPIIEFTETIGEPDQDGNYVIIRDWTITDDCGNQTTFQQIVNVTTESLEAENAILCIDDPILDLYTLINEVYEDTGHFEITMTEEDYELSDNYFDPTIAPVGEYTITYYTDDACDLSIEFIVLVDDGCFDCKDDMFISKAITPNGDIYNDYFKVEGIDDCGIPSLKIFNRWGNLVFQSDDYDSKKGRWRGTSEGGVTIGGENKLPTGTYYYIIEFRNSFVSPITGHVYLSTK